MTLPRGLCHEWCMSRLCLYEKRFAEVAPKCLWRSIAIKKNIDCLERRLCSHCGKQQRTEGEMRRKRRTRKRKREEDQSGWAYPWPHNEAMPMLREGICYSSPPMFSVPFLATFFDGCGGKLATPQYCQRPTEVSWTCNRPTYITSRNKSRHMFHCPYVQNKVVTILVRSCCISTTYVWTSVVISQDAPLIEVSS